VDLSKNLENNPVPYLMLMTESVYPLVHHGDFEVLQVTSESHSAALDTQAIKKKIPT
jgi:hypothetical protein